MTALRLAVMLKRSGKARARISEKTLRIVSRRTFLRDAFVVELRGILEELGIVLVRIPRGGFVLITIASLEGAPPITARAHPEVRRMDQRDLEIELALDDPDDEE